MLTKVWISSFRHLLVRTIRRGMQEVHDLRLRLWLSILSGFLVWIQEPCAQMCEAGPRHKSCGSSAMQLPYSLEAPELLFSQTGWLLHPTPEEATLGPTIFTLQPLPLLRDLETVEKFSFITTTFISVMQFCDKSLKHHSDILTNSL